ncbi:MAG: ABC transporter substrate-binding protein [Bacteroidales bacterium]|nr:ABC transporter substrate-binding protein [Bacteroidales bacterium]
MKVFSGIAKAFLALVMVSAILLVSDLNNRNSARERSDDEKGETRFYKICLVHYVDSPNSEECEEGVRAFFEDQGWEEDTDFSLQVYNSQGDMSTLNSIAGTVSSQRWDLVMASSTPTNQVLVKKVTESPIVFINVGDPIIAGFGDSFEQHLPNITGISTMSDFAGLVDMITIIHPNIKRIGTVFTPAEINSVAYKERLEEAASDAGIELISIPAASVTEVADAAISLSSRKIGAYCQISDNLTASCSATIIKASRDARIPYYGFITKQIDQGAVAVAARDYHQAGYDAGRMAKDVLEGKSPGTIPFEYVTKTIYRVNNTAATFYKVELPKKLLSKYNLTK